METHKPTPEEIAKDQESRTLSDAELIKGGAHYVPVESGEPRLEVTPQQVSKVKKEMVKDLSDRRESEHRKNMSEEEVKSEMEQKFKDTVTIVAEKVKGKAESTGTSYARIEGDRKVTYENESTDGKKVTYSLYLTLKKDEIAVEYYSYFKPDIYNRYHTTFSSIFTPKQIADTAEMFVREGYGVGDFANAMQSFKDRVERGER